MTDDELYEIAYPLHQWPDQTPGCTDRAKLLFAERREMREKLGELIGA